ncbi:hypothetical protein Ssi02_38960 [Sinosporangium siamense]|uniref:Helicase/secretion neighborhood TadE-like protein n=2 Tax=Sinosporangium siamense TaxID=1367973 RepID=A0A919RIY6_9ACTN|nr:hypothetical protein Ssi02_38960 [Sinosporangium siamense]
MLTVLAAYVFALVGAIRVARHRAQAAADLSALSAAKVMAVGRDRACDEAATLAKANGAFLQRCDLVGETVEVRVAIRFPVPGVGLRIVIAHARAGPVSSQVRHD